MSCCECSLHQVPTPVVRLVGEIMTREVAKAHDVLSLLGETGRLPKLYRRKILRLASEVLGSALMGVAVFRRCLSRRIVGRARGRKRLQTLCRR